MTGFLSPWHIAIFVLVVLIVFGPKKLPEMGRMLGSGMREFKDGITGHFDEASSAPVPPATLASTGAPASAADASSAAPAPRDSLD